MIETETDIGTRDTLKLSGAILIYQSQRHTTMTVHDVQIIRGKPVIAPGHVPSPAATIKLATSLLESQYKNCWLPAHILVSSPTTLAWWEPPRARRMYFKTQDAAVNALSGSVIPQPTLLYIASGNGLRVVALATDERPTPETPVFFAPHYNLFDTHDVCLGSTELPDQRDPLDTAAWSTAYFSSAFTHAAGTTLRHRYPGSYAEMLAQAAADGVFHPDWLRQNGTLQDISL